MKTKYNWGLNDKLYFKLLRRELLIFMLPVILLFSLVLMGINRQYQSDEAQLIQKLEDNVQIIQTSLDEYIQRCQAINYVLMQDNSIYYLRNTSQSDSIDDKIRIHQAANLIHSQCLINDFLEDIVICVNHNNINVNRQGAMSAEQVYEQFIFRENDSYSYEQWRLTTSNLQNGYLFTLPDNTCYFVTTFPVTQQEDDVKCFTMMKFKDSIFSSYLKDTFDTAFSTVFNMQSSEDLFQVLKPLNIDSAGLKFPSKMGTFTADGYYISFSKSERLNIIYLTGAAQGALQKAQRQQIFWIIRLLILSLLLGGGIIMIYSMKKLNPLNQLRATVQVGAGHSSSFLDPYAETKSILLETADEQITYLNKSRKPQTEHLKHNFIVLLHEKKEHIETLSDVAKKLNIPYEDKQGCFIKLKCIDISNYFQEIGEKDDTDCTPIQFCTTLIEEMLSENYDILAISYGSEAYFVFSAENQISDLQFKEFKQELQQTQRLLQESYGIDTLISLSGLHHGIKGLYSAFKETNMIMEYMEFSAVSNFVEYGVISVINKHRGINDEFIKVETKMLNAIKAEDFDCAKELFDQVLLVLFPNMQYKSKSAKFHVYALAGKMLEAFDTINRMNSEHWLEELGGYDQLMDFNTLSEFHENMYKLFDSMKESTQETESSNKNSLVSNIIEIITENYMNPDLNVSMIATLLDKNLDYVSRTFKKSTGLGILECIQDYRIGKAKGYLEENPNLTIRQVSSMVGYVNCESFIRIFKQKQGVTPGRYKTTLKKKE